MEKIKDFARLMVFWVIIMPLTIAIMVVTGVSDFDIEDKDDDRRSQDA